MHFRSASNSDGTRVREVVFAILREFGFTPDPKGTDSDLFDLESSYLAGGGAFELLVDDDEQIIGTVGLMPHGPGVCELRKMYLEREQRGRGLGRQMLEHAIATARRLGFRRIELETESRLKDAIKLYQQFGFQPVCCENICTRCDQTFALDLTTS